MWQNIFKKRKDRTFTSSLKSLNKSVWGKTQMIQSSNPSFKSWASCVDRLPGLNVILEFDIRIETKMMYFIINNSLETSTTRAWLYLKCEQTYEGLQIIITNRRIFLDTRVELLCSQWLPEVWNLCTVVLSVCILSCWPRFVYFETHQESCVWGSMSTACQSHRHNSALLLATKCRGKAACPQNGWVTWNKQDSQPQIKLVYASMLFIPKYEAGN